MVEIPLSAIPRQTISIQLGNSLYNITIHALDSVVVASINRDNIEIVTGQRIVPGYPIIPYRYLEDGNFILTSDNDEYADYLKFGVNQFLIFATSEEIATLRAGV